MYSNISSFLPPKEPIYILSSGCSKGKDGVAVHICCQQMSTWIRKRCKRLSDIKLPICKYFIIHSFFLFFFPNSKKERKKEKRFGEKDKNNCMYMSNIVNATLSVRLTYSGTFANVQLVNDPGCCPISVSLIL